MIPVLVVNSGSSSLKFRLIDVTTGDDLASGLIERVGLGEVRDHRHALELMILELTSALHDCPPVAVGHRVVHGGTRFTEPTVIDERTLVGIADLSTLAPLHNPANLVGIEAAMDALPDIPHVAVFDTAFHQTLAPEAYTYALDAELAHTYDIRRYGFHGTSHQFVAARTAEFLARPETDLKLIILHLGNGASACAVDGGISIETSMGLTPLEGLVMGTRSGDIDPAILLHLNQVAHMSIDDLDRLVNRQSGLLGLSGMGDMRDVTEAAANGDARAELALSVFSHRIRHYIGGYLAALGGLDAVVFTAGIGENSAVVRERVISPLAHLGLRLDMQANTEKSHQARRISPTGATPDVLVIPTNEEFAIAQAAYAARVT